MCRLAQSENVNRQQLVIAFRVRSLVVKISPAATFIFVAFGNYVKSLRGSSFAGELLGSSLLSRLSAFFRTAVYNFSILGFSLRFASHRNRISKILNRQLAPAYTPACSARKTSIGSSWVIAPRVRQLFNKISVFQLPRRLLCKLCESFQDAPISLVAYSAAVCYSAPAIYAAAASSTSSSAATGASPSTGSAIAATGSGCNAFSDNEIFSFS